MKKQTKKIVIHKETLRRLEDIRLQVGGAAQNLTPLSCDDTCGFDTCRCNTDRC